MDSEIRKRLRWIQLYKETGNAGTVCLRCGISRPTLRKWLCRFEMNGIDGLKDESRKPKSSPLKKVTTEKENLILEIRNERRLGHRRISTELKRLHNISLSLATIHKVLKKNNVPYLQKRRKNRKKVNRYNRPVPGDRVQIDVCKIAPGFYQYTAVDDCSRYLVVALFKRRTATNSIRFLEQVVEEMPFAVQRIQTDRGSEFFAEKFQKCLMDFAIKFRPIKPASPHLNGKVERVQRTVLDEFYATVDIKGPELEAKLAEWQHYYNWHRSHSSLHGKTPIDIVCELIPLTPYTDEISEQYEITNERIQEQNYKHDLRLKKLKRSL